MRIPARAIAVAIPLCIVAACQSNRSPTQPANTPKSTESATANPLGAWLFEEQGGFALFVFREAGRGGMMTVGGGHAIGAPLRYSIQADAVVVTPPKTGTGPFEVKIAGNRMIMPRPDGSTVAFRRISNDHPTYAPYIANIDQEVQRRGDEDFE